MNTFLSSADFKKCAECLDNKRLPNQVNREVLTLIRGGWKNHPIAKMWRGHGFYLGLYGLACCRELKKRGYQYKRTRNKLFWEMSKALLRFQITKPHWLGKEDLHRSHRLNLLYKYPEHYRKIFREKVPKNKPAYVWYSD